MSDEIRMIKVSKCLYSREVLLKTAFSFTDKVYLHLAQDEDNWIISWKPREKQDIDAGEFENELIAQSLRETLLKENKDLRQVILARAFASTVKDNKPGEAEAALNKEALQLPEETSPISDEEKADILRGWFDE